VGNNISYIALNYTFFCILHSLMVPNLNPQYVAVGNKHFIIQLMHTKWKRRVIKIY